MNVDDFLSSELSRRRFLGDSARNAAGMAAGIVGLGNGAFGETSPSERVRVAVIGVRSHGNELASALARLPDVRVAALCDVDHGVLEAATTRIADVQGTRPAAESDFRHVLDDPSIQAVVIATPDHWHAAMTVLACQAGKDVYVEAPVSHTIAEGAAMVAAARKHARIVQSGLQQRSGEHFRTAVELVKSGEIGNVRLAKAWVVHRRKPIGFKVDGLAPEGVDYDRWLGPAPAREFNPNRFHHNWHWFWDYGSGELGNWGVHLLDVARWGLGAGLPLRVSATGGKLYFHDDQQTPDTLSVQFSYPKASLVWEHRTWSNHGVEGRSAAVAFYGDNGTLIVDRGGWKVYGRRDTLTADASELLTAHLRNFIDCVKSRKTPAAEIEVGHLSSTLCHLGNIAWRLRREVQFDPAGMNFGWDGEANRLLSSEAREPWALPTA
jgi:predicted dehydrogenase